MSYAGHDIGDAASSAARAPSIRTVLSEFCEAFDARFRPILDPLLQAAEALADAPESLSARTALPTLRDIRHQMQALVDKVAEQQAYVLIFGPIKSGKSTFMNALSAAYVSEVTCLPAYPCMVYVSHSDTPGFVVTHYDGRTASFTHRDALREILAHAHRELTCRIREVEAAGGVFDPAVHMPDAIRKIDIKIAIEDLEKSGAVLVDTPGLYTRMKFGYDRMTRDFRNAAACAIFIVKTDNLFLEQVFDEFNELLELFSRIFLVVNLDSTKKDLLPSGRLAPSLEHENPWEIIEAFEHLSMTAPLKQAAEDGRLGIYPVDLLRSASRRILARADGGSAADGELEALQGEADFDALLQDLTNYLDSNEYLKAFLDDSLRRSRSLIEELSSTLQGSSMQQLRSDVDRLREEHEEARARAEIVARLRRLGWRDQLQGLTPWLLGHLQALTTRLQAKSTDAIDAAVEQWFESSHSLHHLVARELLAIFASARSELIRDTENALKRRASEAFAGMPATKDLEDDLKSIGVDINAIAEASLGGLKERAAMASPRPALGSEQIPVRKSFADWLLLRSRAAVRRRLLGPPEQPDAQLAPSVKALRLGTPAREALRQVSATQVEALIDEAARTLPEALVRGYAERFALDLSAQLERAAVDASQRLEALGGRLSESERASDAMLALTSRIESVAASVDALIERFTGTDAAALKQPAVGDRS